MTRSRKDRILVSLKWDNIKDKPENIITEEEIAGINSGVSEAPVNDNDTLNFIQVATETLKKIKWSGIKAALKNYFDTLYSATGHTHDSRYYTETEVNNKLTDKANVFHNHDSDYAVINHNHVGTYEPVFSKNTAFNKNFGTAAGTVCEGDDSRLSNARPPTAHTHDNRYYTETEVDSKLADKANVSHHHDSEYADISHDHSGTYEPAFSKNSAFNKNFGSASGTVCQGNDSRLSNQRTPTDNSVDTSKLAARYKSIIGMTGVDVDWSAGQVFTKTLSANSTLTFSNLHVGVKDLEITGSYTLALPSGFKLISGEYDGSVLNFIQIVCTDPATPKGWVVISQEAS